MEEKLDNNKVQDFVLEEFEFSSNKPDDDFNSEEYDDAEVYDNDYIKAMVQASDLFILQEGLVKMAYQQHKEVGLFHLFFTHQYIGVITQWTNEWLYNKYNYKITE